MTMLELYLSLLQEMRQVYTHTEIDDTVSSDFTVKGQYSTIQFFIRSNKIKQGPDA